MIPACAVLKGCIPSGGAGAGADCSMSITFEPQKGLTKIIRRKPVMRLYIGKPIDPIDTDLENDSKLRMKAVREQMESFVKHSAAG